jgi:Tol biopolymer transport system component
LWVFDLLRGSKTRLTLDEVSHDDPRWLPDSSQIIFGSTIDASNVLLQVPYPSSSDPKPFHNFNDKVSYLDDLSPNEDYLLFHAGPELWALPLVGEKKPELVARSLSGEIDQSQFSPDGNWIAFNTNESGRPEVMVVPFPPRTGEEYSISADGGVQPTWRNDGRELYFLARDGSLMAVDIEAGEKFEYGDPKRLFTTQLSPSSGTEQYAPHPGGEKFLFMNPTASSAKAPITVITNWTSLLEK